MSLKSKLFLLLSLIPSTVLWGSSDCQDISGTYFCEDSNVRIIILQKTTNTLLSYQIKEFGLTKDNTPIEATFIADKKKRSFPGTPNYYQAVCHSNGLRVAVMARKNSSYHNFFEYILTDEKNLFIGSFIGLMKDGDIEGVKFIRPGPNTYCIPE